MTSTQTACTCLIFRDKSTINLHQVKNSPPKAGNWIILLHPLRLNMVKHDQISNFKLYIHYVIQYQLEDAYYFDTIFFRYTCGLIPQIYGGHELGRLLHLSGSTNASPSCMKGTTKMGLSMGENGSWVTRECPIGSMLYGISTYVWLIFVGNVGKYTITWVLWVFEWCIFSTVHFSEKYDRLFIITIYSSVTITCHQPSSL